VAEDPERDSTDIDDLLDAVADGSGIDWEARKADAADTAERGIIEQFEIIANITRFHHDSCASTRAGDEPPRVVRPTSWGPFLLRGTVGSGSYGTVFRAWDPSVEREVALKLLNASDASDGRVPEASLLTRVRHPNVVKVFGAGRFEGCVGLWMEFITGRTLKAILDDQGTFSAQEAVLIGLDLCGALAAVHRAGVRHCDIKTQNVMRETGGRIVLMDFGAAFVASAAADLETGLKGTPLYVAPELFEDTAPTELSDLYSLGVLLYYLVTGEFPVTGRSLEDLRRAHATDTRRLLRDARPDLPPAFVRAVDQALARNPAARPSSAGRMEALLEAALGRRTHVDTAPPSPPLRAANARSIAVLPFTDLSVDRRLEFFCDGISEEIANALARLPGLRVLGRNSTAQLRDGAGGSRAAAAALAVGTMLEGSVRASANDLRVIARLIDTADGSVRWSERFDRTLDDVFAVQDEIAKAVVRALGVPFASGVQAALPAPAADGATSVAVYSLYLKARHYWNRRTEDGLRRSVTLLQQAIEQNPWYAEAYAALGEAYATLGLYGVVPPSEAMPNAAAAATRAIELRDTLPGPFATLGCIAGVYEWNWPDGERQFRRAIDVNPANPAAHHWYAINHLVPLARFGEANEELQRAADNDPLSMPIRVSVGLLRYFARAYDEAERELRDSLELDAGSVPGRLFLGLTLVELARGDDALRELETAAQLSRSPEIVAAMGYAAARGGQSAIARRLLDELLALSRERYVSPSLVAQIYAGLGEVEPALEWLEHACNARAADLAWLAVRPVFDVLRPQRRFTAMLDQLALAPEAGRP
jgi:eukaryotic-like serine/threonine-protein kinase